MNPERWQQVKAILQQALERQGESRLDFVAEITADDPELRLELESLIAAHEGSTDSFLKIPAAATQPDADATLFRTGSLIGNYRLISEIGQGGMGQVWLAEQIAPVRRLVALKLIRAGMYDESVVQRFQSERQSLAIMDHPVIAKVFDAGSTSQGQPYFVMEYVPGLSITEYCDQHKLKIRDRIELFIQVCEGVQHAHQKAIIHRDLKPANILIIEVDGKPVPRIIDFGVARSVTPQAADQTQYTRFGQFIGTPGFMSPEQIDPNIRDIDTRTDVYSLGVVLYVLLAGLQPFETSGGRPPLDEWLRQLREDEPPSLSAKLNADRETGIATAAARSTPLKQLASMLRGDLDWITMKTLERDRERRYGTPSELAADLRRYLNDEAVVARPASAAYQVRKYIRRHRVALSVAIVLILTLAVGLAATSYEAKVASTQRDLALQAQLRAVTQTAAARLRDADVPGALAIILEVLPNRETNRSYTPEALSVFQEARARDAEVLAITGHEDAVLSASFAPDGRRLATTSIDGSARIWDAASGRQLVQFKAHTSRVNSAFFSPDGRRVVTASHDKTARIWDAATGRQIMELIGHTERVWFAAFSPDGSRVVTASYDKTARVWDAATGRQIRLLSGHTDTVHCAVFSPDGRRIATASYDKTARIWDAETGRQITVLGGHGDLVLTAAFAPDGRHIVTASVDNTARVWDVDTGQQILLLAGHTNWLAAAAFSPDGNRVVTASYDKTARIWDAATGRQLLLFSGHATWLASAAFSPDGNRVVTASYDKTARLWDVAAARQIMRLSGHTSFLESAEFSPDDKLIVTASYDKTARIWDAATGRQIQVLSGHTDLVNCAEFSPDGARILTASNDMTARIWDAASGRQIQVLIGHLAMAAQSSFSPDGRRAVTASGDKTARIWDTTTGRQIMELKGHSGDLSDAEYSPDGRRVLTASYDNTARIWDAETGSELLQLRGHAAHLNSAVFSPDGRRVLTSSYDNTARIWDATTGRQLLLLSGHTDSLANAAYSPDGKRVVTASHDKSTRIWDAATGLLQLQLIEPDLVEYAAFSRDGRRVVTASDDKHARVWDVAAVPLDTQIEWAEAAQFDRLSSNERFQLGLPPATGTRQWNQESSKCDELAAAPYDPNRHAPGVMLEQIEADIAVAACADSQGSSDSNTQRVYEEGRALMARADFSAAGQHFSQALAAGYATAGVDFAMLLARPKAGMLDIQRAIALYEQAWKDGLIIAAFDLGNIYENGVRLADGKDDYLLAPDSTRAWAWYSKAANAGQPNALARFAELEDSNAFFEQDPQKRNLHSIESFKHYAAASQRAQGEDWPDAAWKDWRYHRASLARLLARDGMTQEVAAAYAAVVEPSPGPAPAWLKRAAAEFRR